MCLCVPVKGSGLVFHQPRVELFYKAVSRQWFSKCFWKMREEFPFLPPAWYESLAHYLPKVIFMSIKIVVLPTKDLFLFLSITDINSKSIPYGYGPGSKMLFSKTDHQSLEHIQFGGSVHLKTSKAGHKDRRCVNCLMRNNYNWFKSTIISYMCTMYFWKSHKTRKI